MSVTSRVGSAMAAGYLLGRFKKLRLAIIVGSALASDDVRSRGATLLMRGPVGLAEPAVRKVGKSVGSQLMESGRSAAVGAASSRIGGLSDRLSARTSALRGDEDAELEDDAPEDDASEDEDFEDDALEDEDFEDDADEESEFEDDDEPEDEDEPIPAQRSPRRRRSSSPAGR